MNDQAFQDDGAIPPPPPPPQQDPAAYYDPNAGQGGQQGDQSGQQAGGAYYDPNAQQYQGQYDQNFAHAAYDPYAAQQPVADQAAEQAQQWQPDPTQQMPVSQGGQYYDPYAQQPAQQGMPQGGFDPFMGPPMGDDGTVAPPPGAPPAPPKPVKPANFQLGTKLGRGLKIRMPAHNLQFDEEYFLKLLAGSISLSKDEKKRIIESIPKLRQSQVDELIRIFEEEKEKFAELGEEHVAQLEKLATQHYEDWIDIEMGQEQQSKASDDQAQADEIRKQLGI